MTFRSWQDTINQDECLLIILNVQGCWESVYKTLRIQNFDHKPKNL